MCMDGWSKEWCVAVIGNAALIVIYVVCVWDSWYDQRICLPD
ncbi:hypothetical protein [Planococcus lenghuensis]|nr:hypothetical protein [Planococcus lenghuensis]